MHYQNQFLLTQRTCPRKFDAKSITLGTYYFYYHKNAIVTSIENTKTKIISIGDLYDYKNPTWGNKNILGHLLKNSTNFITSVRATSKYSGEYILFYWNKVSNELNIFSDVTAQYELFYSIVGNSEIIASSNFRLIESVNPLIENNSSEAIEFFNSNAFQNRKAFVGSDTNFINLKKLKPNHYLEVTTGKSIRYFPHEKVEKTSLSKASKKGAEMLKGYITAAAHRYKLLVPVTAGWDSRLILAASKNVAERAIYHVLYSDNSKINYDLRIPNKLFKRINLPFFIIKIPPLNENNLPEEVLQNILFPNKYIYKNVIEFYNKYPGFIALNGNVSEIARLEFDEIFYLTPKKIAFIEKYPYLNYALKRLSHWYESNRAQFEENGFRVLDMLYWEENCANWVAKSKTEYRILGQNVFSPFNSRELLLTLYGLPKKYRRKQNPVVYREMIKILWPEVLQVPVNPGLKKIAMRITQYIGIFPVFRNLKLNYNLFKGRNKW